LLVRRNRLVIDVDNILGSKVVGSAVIKQSTMVPAAALISVTRIAVAIVDTAIEADGLRPIAGVKNKSAVDTIPIRGSPEQPCARRLHPCSRYPIVVADVFTPSPEPRHPEIARLREDGIGGGAVCILAAVLSGRG
jgi:hypothetical protein